jgi:hypothetical protein
MHNSKIASINAFACIGTTDRVTQPAKIRELGNLPGGQCMKKWNYSVLTIVLAVVVSVTFGVVAAPAHAQTFFGSIVGNVSDPSGAIIPGAKVIVTNVGTNEKRESLTDAAGDYRIVNLVPAIYKLEVEKSGFKHVTRDAVEVRVQSETRIDIAMQIGATSETVEVTSQTPLLQTESGANSDVVEGQRVQEMPLNGRNTMNLIALTPGVVSGAPQGSSALNMGTHTANSMWADYSIAGGFSGASAMYFDAAPLNLLGGTIVLIPTQDAVQEFQIASSGVSPEFGHFGGGVINMTSKSGTNQWHGSVYEYFRNKVFNANSFFSNNVTPKVPRGLWNQNQYGVTLTNPIKKDKIFSFFSWEGFRLLAGIPAQTNVPNDNIRAGKFYSPATSPITDPFNRPGCVTQGTDAGGNYYQINMAVCADPTANIMLNTLKYWPEPLQPNDPNANFRNTPNTGNNANQFTERVDWNLNDKQRLFARYTSWRQVDLPYNQLGNFTKNSFSHNYSQQAVLGDTYTLNQSSILDVRLDWSRQFTDNQPFTLGKDLSVLGGAWGTLQTQLNPKYMPGPHVLGAGGYYPMFGMNPYSQSWLNNYSLEASLSKIKGSHSLKVGGEIRLSDANGPGFTLQGGGFFLFVGAFSGNNFSDFLFGTPLPFGNSVIQKVSSVASYNWYQGYYLADAWQVNRKLTLNYGVRWELPGSIAERHDRNTVLLPTTNDPTTGVKGTLAAVNSSMYGSRYVSDVRYDLLAPRIGFAYRLSANNVIRGGYGLTYYPGDMSGGLQAANSPVNTATTNVAPYFTGTTLSNPFPGGLINTVGHNITPAWRQSLIGQTLKGPVPHQSYPWSQMWNLNLGHQFPKDVMVEVGYTGSSSTNLPTTLGLDELPKQDWNAAGALQTNRPYGANYTDVQNTAADIGVASYNSGLVKIEKRFHSGGVISANYTYSKSLADVESPVAGNNASAQPNVGNGVNYGAQDYNNFRNGEYSLSSFDVRQRAIISYVLNLPFGEGQKWAHYSGIGGTFVSGWSVNGITSFQMGFPMGFTQGNGNKLSNGGFGIGTLRPDLKPGCDAAKSGPAKYRLNAWFDKSCYAVAGTFSNGGKTDYAIGSSTRTDPFVRTPGVHNWDLSILKSTKIHENINAQFRAEFFNLFNHPQFAAPQGAVDDPVNFGVIIAQANNPRLAQFSLRINF